MPLDRRQQVADEARHRRGIPAGRVISARAARVVDRAVAAEVRHAVAVHVDHAVVRLARIAQVALQDQLRGAGVRPGVIVVGDQVAAAILAQERAVVVADGIVGVVLVRERHVAAPLGEIVPGLHRHEAVAAVAVARHADLRAAAHPLEVALEDEVDHARYAVGAVHRRRAAGQHVDAVDQPGRDRADVDRRGVDLTRDMAAAVDQHQRPRRTEAAQVEQVEARRRRTAGY